MQEGWRERGVWRSLGLTGYLNIQSYNTSSHFASSDHLHQNRSSEDVTIIERICLRCVGDCPPLLPKRILQPSARVFVFGTDIQIGV